MAKFHINPETKEIGKCTASIQDCRYGATAQHYSTIQEAYEASEQMLQEEYGNFTNLAKKTHDKEDFSQRIPAGASLSVYIDENDPILYNDKIYTVKGFHYERGLLSYIVDTEEEGKIQVHDDDWYHSSKISVLKDKKKNAQFTSTYYTPDEFNTPVEEGTNLAQLDYDLERGMTIKLNNDLLTIQDVYISSNDDGEYFRVIKSREYGPVEVREEDIPNIRFYGGTPEKDSKTYTETDYNEPLKEANSFTHFPPGRTGSDLSDYISNGDSIEYNGEIYKVNDFEYNRARLSYELETDQGTIYIHDDDWYHDSKINIVKK